MSCVLGGCDRHDWRDVLWIKLDCSAIHHHRMEISYPSSRMISRPRTMELPTLNLLSNCFLPHSGGYSPVSWATDIPSTKCQNISIPPCRRPLSQSRQIVTVIRRMIPCDWLSECGAQRVKGRNTSRGQINRGIRKIVFQWDSTVHSFCSWLREPLQRTPSVIQIDRHMCIYSRASPLDMLCPESPHWHCYLIRI